MSFENWKRSPEGRAAADHAGKMSKQEMVAEILTILMRLAGESDAAIAEQREKCLRGGAAS